MHPAASAAILPSYIDFPFPPVQFALYWQAEFAERAERAAKAAKLALGLGEDDELPLGGGSPVEPPQGFGTDGEL